MDGTIKSGAHPIEKALTGSMFYKEANNRGYNIKSTFPVGRGEPFNARN